MMLRELFLVEMADVYGFDALFQWLKNQRADFLHILQEYHLEKVFRRWIINDETMLSKLPSLNHLPSITMLSSNDKKIIAAKAKASPNAEFFLPNQSMIFGAVNHLQDWFKSLDLIVAQGDTVEATEAKKVIKSLPHIYNLSAAWKKGDEWFAWLQTKDADPNAVEDVVTFPDGYRWVNITSCGGLDYEGQHMQHCVGGSGYDKGLEDGTTIIYSLRDPTNHPHVTVEAEAESAESHTKFLRIRQIKGKQNDKPAKKYIPYLGGLFNKVEFGNEAIWKRKFGLTEPAPKTETSHLDNFTRGYLVGALWSSTDDDGEPLDDEFDVDDFAPSAVAAAIKSCTKFQKECAELLNQAYDSEEERYDEMQAGTDFWLTRNGHGTGFRERDLGDDVGHDLATVARKYGEVYIYVGDDGHIHI
jgi:hypothetical protein